MSYLVIKQSGSNKSFELKTSVPAKPYMAVKTAVAGTAYLALGTNTTGTGMLVKGANQNYKVVESYTTTTDRSSTYNSYYQTTSTSYYTDTTTINSTAFNTFTYDITYFRSGSVIGTISAQMSNKYAYLRMYSLGKIVTNISVKKNFNYKGGHLSEVYQRVHTDLDLVLDDGGNTYKGFAEIVLQSNSGTLVSNSTYMWYQGWHNDNDSMLCSITSTSMVTRQNTSFINQYRGILLFASAETGQKTRPSDPYQTYSEATSYYTETITVQ